MLAGSAVSVSTATSPGATSSALPEHPETAKRGVLLRKFGQEVIRVTAGKRVHGTGAVPGGVNKSLTIAERDELLKDIYQIVQWSRDAVHLIQKVHTRTRALQQLRHLPLQLHVAGRPNGDLDFYHGTLRARDDNGNHDLRPPRLPGLQKVIEGSAPWSYMKFPSSVPSARSTAGTRSARWRRAELRPDPDPFAEHERKEFVDYAGGSPMHAAGLPLDADDRDAARRRSDQGIAARRRPVGDDLMVQGERQMEGVGSSRPRGTLFHHYRSDENDVVTMANLIVLDHQQQPGDERGRPPRCPPLPAMAAKSPRAAQPHRGRHPRLRPLPQLQIEHALTSGRRLSRALSTPAAARPPLSIFAGFSRRPRSRHTSHALSR